MNKIATQNNHIESVYTCPHCKSTSITRSGFDRGTQRYRCKSCSRTFKATAGKPIHGLHKKEKITLYLAAMQQGMSIRKAAEYAGISKNTSFAWRHKFLSSLERSTAAIRPISEIASVEIIQVGYSAKGRRKPPEKHISATKTMFIVSDGQLELHKLAPIKQTQHTARIFTEHPARFYAAMPHKTITAGIKHSENTIRIKKRLINQPLIKGAKLQVVKLLCWMERFRGVASKYLQNYWNWYATLLNMKQLKQETEHFSRLCTNNRSLVQYFHTKNI